jgi:hypothetical protein
MYATARYGHDLKNGFSDCCLKDAHHSSEDPHFIALHEMDKEDSLCEILGKIKKDRKKRGKREGEGKRERGRHRQTDRRRKVKDKRLIS